jgi:hypothetical protein
MKRVFRFAICLFTLLSAAVVPALAGEVIDGVVATVNRQPLLRSDWDEAVRFEAFMRQKPLTEVTPEDRGAALRRLIDRQLIQAQMGDAGYMQPSEEVLAQDLARLRAQVSGGASDENWRKVLTSYGLTEEIAKQHLRTEFQVMNFVEVRLRPNIHIQDEEVEAYYKNQLLPDLQKAGGKAIALDEVQPRIRELLTQQRMDELLDAWLHNLRQQSEIESTVTLPELNDSSDKARAPGSN